MSMARKVKCINCVNLKDDWCEKVIDSPCLDLERDCRHFKQKTNGDRIRDEELAEFLNRVKEHCEYCQLSAVAGACTETLCDDAMEEWLKQPVEDK